MVEIEELNKEAGVVDKPEEVADHKYGEIFKTKKKDYRTNLQSH